MSTTTFMNCDRCGKVLQDIRTGEATLEIITGIGHHVCTKWATTTRKFDLCRDCTGKVYALLKEKP